MMLRLLNQYDISTWPSVTQYRLRSFFISALDGGEVSTSGPGRFNPGKEHRDLLHRGWVDPTAYLDDLA